MHVCGQFPVCSHAMQAARLRPGCSGFVTPFVPLAMHVCGQFPVCSHSVQAARLRPGCFGFVTPFVPLAMFVCDHFPASVATLSMLAVCWMLSICRRAIAQARCEDAKAYNAMHQLVSDRRVLALSLRSCYSSTRSCPCLRPVPRSVATLCKQLVSDLGVLALSLCWCP